MEASAIRLVVNLPFALGAFLAELLVTWPILSSLKTHKTYRVGVVLIVFGCMALNVLVLLSSPRQAVEVDEFLAKMLAATSLFILDWAKPGWLKGRAQFSQSAAQSKAELSDSTEVQPQETAVEVLANTPEKKPPNEGQRPIESFFKNSEKNLKSRLAKLKKVTLQNESKKHLKWLPAFLLLWLVWPTPWMYFTQAGYNYRSNRFTGSVQLLTPNGWISTSTPKAHEKPTPVELPPEETAKLSGKLEAGNEFKHNLTLSLYNGSQWTVTEVKLSVELASGADRIYTMSPRLSEDFAEPYQEHIYECEAQLTDSEITNFHISDAMGLKVTSER